MKKKKQKKIRYETEKSYRWGLCMKLAKVCYRREFTTEEIESLISHVDQNDVIIYE